MLFVYFINDLPDVCSVQTKIYADDTKAYTPMLTDENRNQLQLTIDRMFEWTQQWQLNFNQSKCQILHIGENNPKHEYYIGEDGNRTLLSTTSLEKDLGVLVDNELNFDNHILTMLLKSQAQRKLKF